MTGTVFLSNKLPISICRARQMLGADADDMDDEAIESIIRRVTVAADVIIPVLDTSGDNLGPANKPNSK